MLMDVLHDFESNNRLMMQKACMIRPVKIIENEIERQNETGEATRALRTPGSPAFVSAFDFVLMNLTGLNISLGPWGIMQASCMMHLDIMQGLHDFHASCRTSDSMMKNDMIRNEQG